MFTLFLVNRALASHVRVVGDTGDGVTDMHVTYVFLRQHFLFVGVQSDALYPQSVYPDGPLLPVIAEMMCELVEQFQFFTLSQMRCMHVVTDFLA
jgi:hypothetical protein